jgi:hypothetical protein
VRTSRHGLSKSDRQHDRAGVGAAPSAEQVRARLAHLRAYRWSSYRAYAGSATAPGWLELDALWEKAGGGQAQRRLAYRHYVESQVKQGRLDSPWEQLQDRVFLGGMDFVAKLKKRARKTPRGEATPPWMRERAGLDVIIQAVEKAKKERWDQFKDRYGDGGLALALTLARKHSGLTLGDLTRKMELKPSMNVSMAIKRYQQRLKNDRAERALATQAEEMLNATI